MTIKIDLETMYDVKPKNYKLFIVVNQDRFFLSHRLPIGVAAKEAGYDVTIICEDTGSFDKIAEAGLKTINLPIDKAGMNIRKELQTFWFLYKAFRDQKPDIIHLVGLKTMLWGSLAGRLAGVKSMVSAVCGLGVLFDENHKDSFISRIILRVLRGTHKGDNVRVIFQNNDDKKLFLDKGVITSDKCAFTNGSGVDLTDYGYSPEPEGGPINVIFTARMVEEKGTLVLIDAARRLEPSYRDKACFLLCGGLDTNPHGITREKLETLCDGAYIQWLGYRSDVKELLRRSHIMAFPSWYREGLPKSVIEAEELGRPIVTTDSVGCRDTVVDGYNGFIVGPRDPAQLATALKMLIDDPLLRRKMGRNAREFAERKFDIRDVVNVHLRVYQELCDS